MNALLEIILLVTTVLVALIAGLFYSYSCSVNPGLARLTDREYLRAMQSINRAILNPLFFLSFLGSLVMLPLSVWIWYDSCGTGLAFYLLLAGALFYIAGVFIVTVSKNVPLNNFLDKTNLSTLQDQELRQRRTAFEIPWNRYHAIRTLFNLAALICVILAIIQQCDG